MKRQDIQNIHIYDEGSRFKKYNRKSYTFIGFKILWNHIQIWWKYGRIVCKKYSIVK